MDGTALAALNGKSHRKHGHSHTGIYHAQKAEQANTVGRRGRAGPGGCVVGDLGIFDAVVE